MSTEPIIGIDLGTTNSVVAAVIDGQATVLEEDGQAILPSVVAMDSNNKLITGTVALNQLAAFPDRTIASIKRRMGTMDPVQLGEQSFTPPEISAMILRRLRDRASRALGCPVTRAVITVPAFFDENQRQATREAGELAGLTVERIINEPTAAALVYHADSVELRHVVVYDFGGGTFDVSVVRMEAGVVEVLSSKGDTKLGGDDFDNLLVDFVASQFQQKHGIDLRDNVSTKFRLLRACEKAKCTLSTMNEVVIAEEFIAEKDGKPLNLKTQISRDAFETLIESMVDRTIECLDQAIADSGVAAQQIDDLVLVGGSTRVPLVQQRLRAEFHMEPSRAVNPDLAVALGAATQGAMLNGQAVGPVLVDVTSHTLGIEALEDNRLVFTPIIHRNSALPAQYEEPFSTTYADQKRVEIHVYQGEHEDLQRNQSIGRFMLELDETRSDCREIVVQFNLTLDGTLKVTATQTGTKRSKNLSIHNALSRFQDEDRDIAESRLGAMFDESEEILDESDLPSKKQWTMASKPDAMSADLLSKFPTAASVLEQIEGLGSELSDEDAQEVRVLKTQLAKAMADNDEAQVELVCAELEDILFYVQ